MLPQPQRPRDLLERSSMMMDVVMGERQLLMLAMVVMEPMRSRMMMELAMRWMVMKPMGSGMIRRLAMEWKGMELPMLLLMVEQPI